LFTVLFIASQNALLPMRRLLPGTGLLGRGVILVAEIAVILFGASYVAYRRSLARGAVQLNRP